MKHLVLKISNLIYKICMFSKKLFAYKIAYAYEIIYYKIVLIIYTITNKIIFAYPNLITNKVFIDIDDYIDIDY